MPTAVIMPKGIEIATSSLNMLCSFFCSYRKMCKKREKKKTSYFFNLRVWTCTTTKWKGSLVIAMLRMSWTWKSILLFKNCASAMIHTPRSSCSCSFGVLLWTVNYKGISATSVWISECRLILWGALKCQRWQENLHNTGHFLSQLYFYTLG